MARWCRRAGWSGRHIQALVAGDLLSIGGPAFLITPLGHPNPVATLVANTVLLGGALAVAATAGRRAARFEAGTTGVPRATPTASPRL